VADLPDWALPAAPLLVTSRFVVAEAAAAGFTSEMHPVIDLLGGLPGCRSVELGRATDDPTLWVLTSTWESVGAYRRALSTYEVKLNAVPLLSRAVDEPSAFEVLYGRQGDVVTSTDSARARDADTVGLGDATAGEPPR
jgi:hypothetical protein